MVGQQFVSRLARHPWFRVTWLAASERSQGKRYREVAPWRLATQMPGASAERVVESCEPGKGPKVVFSGLDASVAGDIEGAFAAAGHIVVSNARNFRMDPLVPLLIPEINADHLTLLDEQRRTKGWPGAIVTNPNCSTVVLAMALAPLRVFNLRAVVVSTMQAVSGAGYPGVASLDILGNVVPFIGGEEEKMESETLKILGSDGGRSPYAAVVSAHANRVAVLDGHTMTVSVDFHTRPSIEDVGHAIRNFSGRPQELWLPSAPQPPIVLMDEPTRPQPRLDADLGGGMAVSVGRLRSCPVMQAKFVALGHNTIRGAAGAAILNAELMHAEGLL
ncbi:MAG: aspartate-semialdehyde dehydrogenase [Acidobacteria bacterium RIFCSPLOWO2_12_FULL_67_14b]|nr:MAG: aspartate-semialdehyde dehydrogenase [Acidobacteria bacterium RIFCSPLOWO2_12_FULL_67_14b]